ncbi:MAG: cytochrome c family protein [Desulfobacterales bacterium]|nr:cytochrome c family protein [Desulfobacterales bacterium]
MKLTLARFWKRKWILCSVGLLAWGASLALAGKADTQRFSMDQFSSPETCSECHSAIVEQWTRSMHNQSHRDPIYNRVAAFLRKGLTDQGEIAEAESCVKCHTPVGYVTGFPQKFSDDLTQTPELAALGIQCDYCHVGVDVTRMYNNGLVLDPGQGDDDPGKKRGPFDDSEPDFHEAEYSELHTSSKFCGTCHNVKHVAFGTDLETTYTEWEQSPYNNKDPKKRVTCQGCHMYQRPGVPATGSTDRPENPGSAADYSDERPHIFTHYFIGGNTGVVADEEKIQMARERLQNAAELSLDTAELKKGKLRVHVKNSGAGHSLPTGLGDLRQVWLEVRVTDPSGALFYQSGLLNEAHELGADAQIFRTVLGDGKGNPVVNLAKAREVLTDTRIKAGETAVRELDLGMVPVAGSKIQVRLLYRGMPQKVLNLVPGERIAPLPVVEMEAVQLTL